MKSKENRKFKIRIGYWIYSLIPKFVVQSRICGTVGDGDSQLVYIFKIGCLSH